MKTIFSSSAVVLALLGSSPLWAASPDGLLTAKTKLSLLTNTGVSSKSVHVDTNDGVVTLYGKVPTAEEKAVVEKVARDIEGVRQVKSVLQIVPQTQEKRVAREDKELREAANKALKDDAALKDSHIAVKSIDKGVALLSGEAHSVNDHLRSVMLVDRIPGIVRVTSEVKGPETFGHDERVVFLNQPETTKRNSSSDMRISAAVKLKLLTTSQVPSTEISVDTDEGVVTLFGIVSTEVVKKKAAAESEKVNGVVKVQNQLEVVSSSQKPTVEAKDTDIARDLALALKDKPEFKDIATDVKNGSVRLSGSVNSGWDEVNAIRTTRQVAGVRGVEDQLKIDPQH